MNFPRRKSPRLKNYDYSAPGAYFVTICTHERRHLFSRIVGAIHESPENKLTECGRIVRNCISVLPDRFDIEIPNYVIMPNHIHLIVIIKEDDTKKRAIHESPLQRHRSVLSKAVGYLKMNVSKQVHVLYPGEKIWQRAYHDHIIRGEKDYRKTWEYIDTNPVKWETDCFYTNEEL